MNNQFSPSNLSGQKKNSKKEINNRNNQKG